MIERMWKATLAVLAMLVAVLSAVELAAPARAASPRDPARGASPAAAESWTVRGVVSGWRLEADGAVLLRLRHPEEGGAAEVETWFRTPPDRGDATSFEDLVLEALLALGDGAELELTAQRERALDGSSPDEALPLEVLARP